MKEKIKETFSTVDFGPCYSSTGMPTVLWKVFKNEEAVNYSITGDLVVIFLHLYISHL